MTIDLYEVSVEYETRRVSKQTLIKDGSKVNSKLASGLHDDNNLKIWGMDRAYHARKLLVGFGRLASQQDIDLFFDPIFVVWCVGIRALLVH